jgi:hypothetical protein
MLNVDMLSVVFIFCLDKCHYDECSYAEYRSAYTTAYLRVKKKGF